MYGKGQTVLSSVLYSFNDKRESNAKLIDDNNGNDKSNKKKNNGDNENGNNNEQLRLDQVEYPFPNYHMTNKWKPTDWRKKPIVLVTEYPDKKALESTEKSNFDISIKAVKELCESAAKIDPTLS